MEDSSSITTIPIATIPVVAAVRTVTAVTTVTTVTALMAVTSPSHWVSFWYSVYTETKEKF